MTSTTISPPEGGSSVPRRGLARITHKELAELREKAKAHDQYLAACRVMKARQAIIMRDVMGGKFFPTERDYTSGWNVGWIACLREFSEAVVTAGATD